MRRTLTPLIPLGIFLGSLAVGYIALAWTSPNGTPPSNNVALPINVSGTAQNKAGNLYLGSSSGSSIFPLRVVGNGIDTSQLFVDGVSVLSNTTTIGSSGGSTQLCLNGDCRTGWPSGLQGGGTLNYLSKFTASGTLGNSQIFDNGTSVGIGTTNPSEKLDVLSGDINLSSAQYLRWNNETAWSIRGRTTTPTTLNGSNLKTIVNVGAGGSEGFSVVTGDTGTGLFEINNSGQSYFKGNVGIGTTNPVQKLDVNGSVRISYGNSFIMTGQGESDYMFAESQGGATNARTRWVFSAQDDFTYDQGWEFRSNKYDGSVATRMYIPGDGSAVAINEGLTVSGNLQITSGLYNSSGYQLIEGNQTDWIRIGNASFTNGAAIYNNIATNGGLSVGSWSVPGAGNIIAATSIKSPQFCIGTSCITSWPSAGLGGSGTTSYLSKFTASGTLGNSQIFDNGTSVAIRTSLDVSGDIRASGALHASDYWYNTGNASYISMYGPAGDSSGQIHLAPAGTERVTITSSGNVGIGTTSPGQKLDVVGGNIRSDAGFCISGSCITSWPSSGSTYTAGTGISIANNVISSTVTGTQWTSSGSQIYYTGGNVGIGTTNPGQKLDVNGNINVLYGNSYIMAGQGESDYMFAESQGGATNAHTRWVFQAMDDMTYDQGWEFRSRYWQTDPTKTGYKADATRMYIPGDGSAVSINEGLTVSGDLQITGSGLYNSSGYQLIEGNKTDWIRIGNASFTNGAAIYNNIATNGGLSVGSWSAPGAGNITAATSITSPQFCIGTSCITSWAGTVGPQGPAGPAGTTPHIEAGQADLGTGGSGTKTINFSSSFASAPAVVITQKDWNNNGGGLNAMSVTNITTTSFQVVWGYNTTYTHVYVYWVAMPKTAADQTP